MYVNNNNRFMKSLNLKKYILLILISFFTSSFALADVREELKDSKSCGTYNGTNVVKVFSWEICEQDFTYRMFYKIMPTIMDEYAIPLSNAKNLKNISTLEKDKVDIYKTNEYSIINIATAIISLSITFGSVLFLWNAFLAFLRTSTDGVFLGNGYSWQKNLIKYSIILVMLLPIGNGLIVINLVVVLLILFAIAFGNAMLSVYLNFFDTSEEAVNLSSEFDDVSKLFKDNEEAAKEYELLRITDGNYFAASKYVEGLFRIQLCKTVTENFIVDSTIDKLKNSYTNNNAEFKERLSCIKRPNNASVRSFLKEDGLESNGYLNNNGFYEYSTEDTGLKHMGNSVNMTSGIDFGYSRSSINNNCLKYEEIQPYNCGSISVTPIKITNADILEIMNKTNFSEAYLSATGSVDGLIESMSVSEVESVISSVWKTYSIKLIKELGRKSDGSIDLDAHDETIIKAISYYFHQQLMNDVFTGVLVKKDNNMKDGSKSSELIAPSNGSGKFNKFNSELSTLSELFIEEKCYSDIELINASNNFKKHIESSSNSGLDKSAYCLLNNNGTLNPYFETVDMSKYTTAGEIKNFIRERNKESEINEFEKINEISEKLKEMSLKTYTDITAIERSFYKSMKTLKSGALTSEMRKIGFFSAGSLGLKLIKSSDTDTKYLSAMRSSVGVNLDMDKKFVGREKLSEIFNSESSTDKIFFPNLEFDFGEYLKLTKSMRLDLRQSNLRSLTQNLINDSASSSVNSDNSLATLISMIGSPLNTFKKAMGYADGVDMSLDAMRECMTDMDKCAIPVENPIIAMTDFGNELVITSTGLMTTTIIVVFADFISNKSKAMRMKHKKTGSVAASANDAIGTAIAGDGFWGSAASLVSSVLSVASFILKTLFPLFIIMLTMGMFFAYIIPLIPFLMFQFSYIAWITMSLTVFFIAPIWLIMNIKMEEDYNTSNNMYRSGYNMAMQVLFRPAILTLAMGIGWGLFSVVFLTLNLTIMPYIIGISEAGANSFIIANVVNSLVIICVYAIIAVILIKYIFNLTYTLVNKMFDAMNVENIDDQKGNITDDVMKSALITSLVGYKGLGQISGMLEKVSANGKAGLNETDLADSIDDKMDQNQYDRDMYGSGDNGSNSESKSDDELDSGNKKTDDVKTPSERMSDKSGLGSGIKKIATGESSEMEKPKNTDANSKENE